jgi:hypothetical protein
MLSARVAFAICSMIGLGRDRRMDCYGEVINCQAHYRLQILLWIVERGLSGVR